MRSPSWSYDAENGCAVIADGVTSVRPGTFRNARRLRTVHCPSTLQQLPTDFCRHAVALCEIHLPETLETLGKNVFADCHALETLHIPENVTTIPEGCCTRNHALKSLRLPQSLNTIGNDAFRDCNALESIDFPTSLYSLGEHAFAGCDALTHIYIPENLTSIPLSALPHGGNLARIDVAADHPTLRSIDGALYSRDGRSLLLWPASLPTRDLTLPEGIEHIAAEAFRGARHLERLVLPHSLRQIDRAAFAECRQLAHVHFTSCPDLADGSCADDGLFSRCDALHHILLPHGLKKLPAFCFAHSGLCELHLPDAVEVIGRGACYGTAISNLALPQGLCDIGDAAFYGVREITLTPPEGCVFARLCQPISPGEPACNCVWHLPTGTLPWLVRDESRAWHDTLACLTAHGGDIDWQAFDNATQRLEKPSHVVAVALSRLAAPNSLSAEHATNYRNLLQQHAVFAADELIRQRDEKRLALLLQIVQLAAIDLPYLLTLAERCAASGCMRLLSLHRPPAPRRFAL